MPGPSLSFGKDELVDNSNPLPVEVIKSVVPNTEITYRDFATVTVSTLALHLVIGSRNGNTQALITNETAALRFRLDGVAPTTTVGHLLAAGDQLTISLAITLDRVMFIRDGGVDGVLSISYGV